MSTTAVISSPAPVSTLRLKLFVPAPVKPVDQKMELDIDTPKPVDQEMETDIKASPIHMDVTSKLVAQETLDVDITPRVDGEK
jgi:hypothetical protein